MAKNNDVNNVRLLQDAFFKFSAPDLVEKYHAAVQELNHYNSVIDPEYMRQMGRVFVYDRRYKNEVKKQFELIKIAFLNKLKNGDLTAWAREGSPLAPRLEVPASAWNLLRLSDVSQNIIKGPDSTLFDVGIVNNQPHDVAPRVKKKGGRPSKMDIVIKEYERRAAEGIGEDSQRGEALYLESWFIENYPDLSSPHHRTIENNISKIVK